MRIFIIAIFFVLFSSCQKNEQDNLTLETIHIDASSARTGNIDELCDSIVIIKLDQNPILGTIDNIQISKDYIFLFDKGRFKIFVFDHNGKYINTLDKRGRAPGEYLYILSFYYKENSQELIINDPISQSLIYYSVPEMQFIKAIKDMNGPQMYIPIDTSHYFCVYANIENSENNGCYIKKDTLMQKLPINNNYLSMSISFCNKCNDTLYYSYSDQNSILYQITAEDCIPRYRIAYGKDQSQDKKLFRKIKPDAVAQLKFSFENKSYAGIALNTIITQDEIVFNYIYREFELSKFHFAVYDKKNKIVKNYAGLTIPGISNPLAPLTTYNEFFISLITPETCDYNESEIKDLLGKTILEEINSTDFSKDLCHPLLIMYKLK